CQTRLEAGEVSYVQEPDADIQPGHCLPCIATPRGDLVLGL
ncbi:MAG: ferredoxin, partial [Candidatus Sedimenticola endophacoides]